MHEERTVDKDLLATLPREETDDDFAALDGGESVGHSLIAPRESRWSPAILGIGFLFFGFALGELAGLSVTQGISQVLLTSVFTFVGGVMLSYAGFRRVSAGSSGRAWLDPLRVGTALACFSVGLGAGVPGGVYARCNLQVQRWFLGEAVEHSQCRAADGAPGAVAYEQSSHPPTGASVPGAGVPSVGVMAGEDNECKRAVVKLNLAVGEPGRSPSELHQLISQMLDACKLTER